jgi:hypothetical protein
MDMLPNTKFQILDRYLASLIRVSNRLRLREPMKSVAGEGIPILAFMRFDEHRTGSISEVSSTDLLDKSRSCIVKSHHTN